MKTEFTIKGQIEIHYDGKVYENHNSLTSDAKKIICHCLAGENKYKLSAIRVLYTCDNDPDGFTRMALSQVSTTAYQNNDTELKLSALFQLEFGEGATSAKINYLQLEALGRGINDPVPAGQSPNLGTFSQADIAEDNVITSSRRISINWIIKPQ